PILERLSVTLSHYLSLPNAVSAVNRLSMVLLSLMLSCPCGSNQSCNMNLAVVCASSLLGSSIQVLPVVTSRYDGMASTNGRMIMSLSVPSTLNVSRASSISIIMLCLLYGYAVFGTPFIKKEDTSKTDTLYMVLTHYEIIANSRLSYRLFIRE